MNYIKKLLNFSDSFNYAVAALVGSLFGWFVVVVLSYRDSNAPDLNLDFAAIASIFIILVCLSRIAYFAITRK